MKTTWIVLFLVAFGYGFDYDRMLARQGYTKIDSTYYSKFDEYHTFQRGFNYSECILDKNTLVCRTLTVNCEKYIVGVYHSDLYLNGRVTNRIGDYIKVSTHISEKGSKSGDFGKYELYGYTFGFSFYGMGWDDNAVEGNSYEDRVCTETAESQLTNDE